MGVGMVLVVSQSVVHQAHPIADQGLRFGVQTITEYVQYLMAAQQELLILVMEVSQAVLVFQALLAITHRLTAEGALPTVMIVADRAIFKEKFNSKTK